MFPSPPGTSLQSEAFAERLAAYRSLREQIERSNLQLATSVDGMVFEFQASMHGLAVRRGGYVMLEGDGAARSGQVTDLTAESQTAATEGLEGAGPGILVRLARDVELDQVSPRARTSPRGTRHRRVDLMRGRVQPVGPVRQPGPRRR